MLCSYTLYIDQAYNKFIIRKSKTAIVINTSDSIKIKLHNVRILYLSIDR